MKKSMPRFVHEFEHALLSLDRITARELITALADNSLNAVEEVIVPALESIGDGWEQGKVALSQVYMAARICEEIIEATLPGTGPNVTCQPLMAIALLEDYHALGKFIVSSSLKASGFDVVDYGRIEATELVDRVIEDNIQILLISTLMLPAAIRVQAVRDGLLQKNAKVKIIVGGAPFRFDDQLWQEVGADAMGKNSADAITIVQKMIEELS